MYADYTPHLAFSRQWKWPLLVTLAHRLLLGTTMSLDGYICFLAIIYSGT